MKEKRKRKRETEEIRLLMIIIIKTYGDENNRNPKYMES